MTSQGTAHGRFQGAIHRRHVQAAEMAAREMGGLSLADALLLCELLANTDPARYERAALRWLQRFIDERLPPHRGRARGFCACGTSARNVTRWRRGAQPPPTSRLAPSPSLGCERPGRPFNTSKRPTGTTTRNITPSIGPDPINTNAPKANAGIANTARTTQAFQFHNCSSSLGRDRLARCRLSGLPEPSLDKRSTNPNRPT